MNMPNEEAGGEWGSGNFMILPEGYYKASVESAEAKVSKNNNKMVELILNVEHREYGGVTIYHHLIFMPDAENFNNKKRRWFQASAGMPYSLNDNYQEVAKLIVNRKLTIKVKTGKDRDDKDRNEIVGVHPYNWKPKNEDSEPSEPSINSDFDETFL